MSSLQDEDNEYKYDNSSMADLIAKLKGPSPSSIPGEESTEDDVSLPGAGDRPAAATPPANLNRNDENSGGDEDGDSPSSTGAGAIHPDVRDYLSRFQKAQEQARQNQQRTGVFAGLAQIAHGISRASGPADVSGILEQGKAADNAPVQALMDQKAAMQMQKESDKADPDSDASVSFRKSLKLVAPQIADAYGDSFDNITAADAPDIMKTVQMKAQLDQRAEAAGLRSDMSKERSAATSDAKRTAAQDKSDKEHNAYLTHIEDKEMGWRSDPASTRFDQNLAAVSTGDAILQKYRGREDEMPVQDIHALVSDKLKAMTGAAPTEQEISAQMPKTLGTKWASTKSFFTGNPEPANAGGFVRSIDNYFKDMEAKSLAGVRNRQKTVAGDPRLTPEERERLVQIGVPQPVYKENAMAGMNSPAPVSPHEGKYPPGTTISVKGKNYLVGADGDSLIPQ